jgi:tetratricopeptide (TPR) repeat protein
VRTDLPSLFFLFISLPLCAPAQVGWGSSSGMSNGQFKSQGCISGVVQTTDGRPVQDASIEAVNQWHQLVSTLSTADGSFTLCDLPDGQYDVIAEKGLESTNQTVSLVASRAAVTLIVRSRTGRGDSEAVSAAQLMVPSKARQELGKAEEALRKKNWVAAARFTEKALTIWPRYAEALIVRTIIERNQHSMDEALADAQKAIDCDPKYGKGYLVLGSVYNDLNRFDDAIRTLDQGIRIAPDSWQGYYEMGRARLYKQDFGGALGEAEKASALVRIDYPPIHLVKGFAYVGLKNQPAARVELEAYLKLEPNPENASRVKQILTHLSFDKGLASDPQKPISTGQSPH